jgi:hypothetical protein
VAVGALGRRIRSLNRGESWTGNVAGGVDLWDVAHGDDTFVAVGGFGRRIRSLDNGVSWENDLTSTQFALDGVAYGDGVFVAVGSNGRRIRSLDGGASWTDNIYQGDPLTAVTTGE